MESRKGEPVDLNAVVLGVVETMFGLKLIYLALKLDNMFLFLRFHSVVIISSYSLMFLLEMGSILLFLINENGFNTKISHLILVVYEHCKIYS